MKICLINPPYYEEYFEGLEYCPFNQPIQHPGLSYIAAVLEQNGYRVDVIECPAQGISLTDLIKLLREKKYDIYGISTYFFNFINVVRIGNFIKSSSPASFLALGGFFPTLRTEETFRCIPELDVCVLGEGEYTFLELVQALEKNEDYKQIQGIAYKEDEKIIQMPVKPLIKDLDSLPMPKVTCIKNGLAGITSIRGCYGSCSFCSVRKYYSRFSGSRVRRRSAQSIVNEMEHLVKEHGARYFTFNDDNFFIHSKPDFERMEQFYQLLKEKDLNIKFRVFARANEIEPFMDLITKLKEVGLDLIFLGIESFVQRQLDMYNKKTSVEQNIKALKILNKIGINYTIGLIIFEPFTTIEEILENLTTLKSTEYHTNRYPLNLPISTHYTLMPLFDSPMYNILQEKDMLRKNDIGFEFKDENVRLFFDVKKLWVEKIKSIVRLLYLVNKARYLKKESLADDLVNEKIKLMALDIDFLIELSRNIKNKNIISLQSQSCEDFVKGWTEKVESIIQKFSDAKDILTDAERVEESCDSNN